MKWTEADVAAAYTKSPPSRGAWIEIPVRSGGVAGSLGRPPRGGRGLKSLSCVWAVKSAAIVAPLAGGVD